MQISNEQLRKFAADIFEAQGVTQNNAATVANHLVDANLLGHDSHGVGMIPAYVHNLETGLLKAEAQAGRVSGEHYTGTWIDVGTPERLDALNVYLSQNKT